MNEPDRTPVDELVGEHAPRSFGPGFVDRVMARVDGETAPRFEELVVQQFRWLAAAATIGALVLGGWSLLRERPFEDQSAVEALLGLEPVTVESVFGVGSIDIDVAESSS